MERHKSGARGEPGRHGSTCCVPSARAAHAAGFCLAGFAPGSKPASCPREMGSHLPPDLGVLIRCGVSALPPSKPSLPW